MKDTMKLAVKRYAGNPILKPADVTPLLPGFEVIGVFNAGVIRHEDEIVLVLRVAERPVQHDAERYLYPIVEGETGEVRIESISRTTEGADFSDSREIRTPDGLYLTSISYLRIARSRDGLHFEVEDRAALFPVNEYEVYGIEDCRVTRLGDEYYLNYSACAPIGITTALAVTRDFRSFERLGIIFHPDNKDVTIFPERIGGRYYALHRPSASRFGQPEIWLAESPDLRCWGGHRHLLGCREGTWESTRIGASAVPVLTDKGWLEIYHGADENNRYCLGAALLEADRPWVVKHRCERPILTPEADYETAGFFGNVVFACGALCEAGTIKLYYGAADTSIGYAELALEELWAFMGV